MTTTMPLPDASFERVIGIEVIEHVENRTRFVDVVRSEDVSQRSSP
ncbi:MAG: hypothetical protein HYR48_06875 [Gemmatimonadetes bacterium]|nr:hypothetical protein [Gemmatimonadota bacterium]